MNKEKAEKISPTYGKLLAENYRLRHNEKVLSNRIDKAIKLIEFEWEKIFKNEKYSNHLWSVDGLVIKKFLSILKGSDK